MPSSATPTAALGLHADLTLNEIVTRWPATHAIFTEHGMDTCCGGAKTLREAATRHGVHLEMLLARLVTVIAAVER